MAIEQPVGLRELDPGGYDLGLIAQPGTGQKIDLVGELKHAKRVLILIGPEGGWADPERAWAKQAGCRPWALGPHVLRIETAAAAAVAIVRYHSPRRIREAGDEGDP